MRRDSAHSDHTLGEAALRWLSCAPTLDIPAVDAVRQNISQRSQSTLASFFLKNPIVQIASPEPDMRLLGAAAFGDRVAAEYSEYLLHEREFAFLPFTALSRCINASQHSGQSRPATAGSRRHWHRLQLTTWPYGPYFPPHSARLACTGQRPREHDFHSRRGGQHVSHHR